MNFFGGIRVGDVRTIWVYGILAVLVLAGGLQGAGKIDIFTDRARLLPGFNQTIPEGTSIVGVNLETGNLMYFTGEKWRKIDIDTKNKDASFVMASYEFKPAVLRDEIKGFYFGERKPNLLNLDISHWRHFQVYLFVYGKNNEYGYLKITPSTRYGFTGPLYPSEYIKLNLYSDLPEYVSLSTNPDKDYTKNFAKLDMETNPLVLSEIITWRDSILEGNKCEKFITFSDLNEKKQKSDKKYTVRRVDNYIFVDLSKPIYEGKKQNWDDDKCLGTKDYNYFDDERSLKRSGVPVLFKYTQYAGRNSAESVNYLVGSLGSFSWAYSLPHQKYISLNKEIGFYYPLISLVESEGIFSYFNIAFNYGDISNEGVFIEGSKQSINIGFIKGKEWQTLSQDEISRFIYKLLDEYNKHLLPPANANPVAGGS